MQSERNYCYIVPFSKVFVKNESANGVSTFITLQSTFVVCCSLFGD